MKTGIIGLPQVGKSSLFRILTKAQLSDHAFANPREARSVERAVLEKAALRAVFQTAAKRNRA